MGFQFIAVGSDMSFLNAASAQTLSALGRDT